MTYLQSTFFNIQLAVHAALAVLILLLPESWSGYLVWAVAALLLCAVGIPHGANDLLYRKDQTTRGAVVFLTIYLAAMALYGGVWALLPMVALAVFFFISVHHFGQSNFESERFAHLPGLLWGLFVLVWPVAIHTEEAYAIFEGMTGGAYDAAASQPMWIGAGALVTAAYLVSAWVSYRSVFTRLALQAALVGLWYAVAPLIGGFIVVFGLWHSSQSLYFQWGHFKKTHRQLHRPRRFFVWNMALYTLAALAFLGVAALFFEVDTAFLFIVLSIVTLPHVVVMDGIYKHTTKAAVDAEGGRV